MEAKQEKISALEVRLTESTSRNSRLKEELQMIKMQHAALEQKQMEESGNEGLNTEIKALREEIINKDNKVS